MKQISDNDFRILIRHLPTLLSTANPKSVREQEAVRLIRRLHTKLKAKQNG